MYKKILLFFFKFWSYYYGYWENLPHTHTHTHKNLILALLIFNIIFLAIGSQYFIFYKGCWEPVDITNTGYHSTRVVQLNWIFKEPPVPVSHNISEIMEPPVPVLWKNMGIKQLCGGWMTSGHRTVFCWVPGPWLTMVVTSVAICFFDYLPTYLLVGSKNSPYLVVIHLPSGYLFSYLSTYIYKTYIFYIIGYQGRETHILTQVRFIHDWVIIGIQWMDGALVGCWFTVANFFGNMAIENPKNLFF